MSSINKKYVWTFWTAPLLNDPGEIPHKLFHMHRQYLMLLYSTELVARNPGVHLEIHTDGPGATMLRTLNVKADIICDLDAETQTTPFFKWARPKLVTIGRVSAPFVHLDHDVFLHELQQPQPQAAITTQGVEASNVSYLAMVSNIAAAFPGAIPEALLPPHVTPAGYNCGYLDVRSETAKQEWVDLALRIFDAQTQLTPTTVIHEGKSYDITNSTPNVVAEQFSLFALGTLAERENRFIVRPLLSENMTCRWRPVQGYQHLMAEKMQFACQFPVAPLRQQIMDFLEANNPTAHAVFQDSFAAYQSPQSWTRLFSPPVIARAPAPPIQAPQKQNTSWARFVDTTQPCWFTTCEDLRRDYQGALDAIGGEACPPCQRHAVDRKFYMLLEKREAQELDSPATGVA